MRKFFSFLMAVLFVGSMYAADPKTSTLTFTKACGGSGVADDEAAWTITSDGTESTYDATKGIHYGTGSAAVGYIQLSTSDIPGTITQVVVNASTANGVSASVTVKVGTTDFKTTGDATSIAATTTATDYTFTGSASGDIVVRLAKAAKANKALYVKSVAVTYTEGGSEPTTKTVYCKMTYSWWTDGSAAVGAYAWKDGGEANAEWPGVKMSAVEGQMGVWTIDLDTTKYDKVIFTRLKGDGTEYWGAKTDDQLIPSDDKDLFTITSSEAQWDGDGKKAAGTWSKYVPETPAKFYIVGDSALVTDAGFAGKAWNPDAIKSETDTFTMNLKAGVDYQLKITTDGTWGTVKGYNKLTKVAAGLKDLDGDNHNIGFKLKEAGEVKVVYTDKLFELIGDFYVPTPHYYIAGSMTNWKDNMVELLPLEEKADSLGVSLNLKADSLYAYKVVRAQGPDTAWYGLDGDATMEYGNSTGWYIYKSEGEKNQKNVGLQTTKEGDYPVTLVIKEDQLIVSVVIPKPDTKYYAKYADKAGEWNWKLLTEKEGKWLTDTIVYYGGGMNIHSAAEGDGKYFAEIAGVAAKDTAYFSFNPEDSTLVATVVGAYVVPIAEDGYYLLGTFNDWTPSAAYMFVANELKPGELVLTATLAVDDEFKVVKCEGVNWTWYPAEGDNFVVMACYAGEKTMYFSPEVNPDWRLLGGHLYMDYTFKPGYYLVGSMTNWQPKSQYWIAEYVDDPPYVLETTLQVGWNIKVAKLEGNGETSQYYPDEEGNHYTVDEEHSGDVYFYFTPGYNGEWQNYWAAKGYYYGWWLMIEKKSTVDIDIINDGVQAVKVLRNGQILIIKGEKTYNAQGQLVR